MPIARCETTTGRHEMNCNGSTRWGVCKRQANLLYRTPSGVRGFCYQHVPQPTFRQGWKPVQPWCMSHDAPMATAHALAFGTPCEEA